MDVLLDSHCMIWALDNPSKLSPVATAVLQDPHNTLHISAVSVWEIAIKVGKGRLSASSSVWLRVFINVPSAFWVSMSIPLTW
jgi:PIN domain nuclease of toxin-antitoxin system